MSSTMRWKLPAFEQAPSASKNEKRQTSKAICGAETKVKKIADFLRYDTNTLRQLHYLQDHEDDAASAVVTLTSRSRRQWSTSSTEAISNYFSSFQKMPAKHEVLRLFSKHPVLCHILKAEGPERCYDKVKNLFRK